MVRASNRLGSGRRDRDCGSVSTPICQFVSGGICAASATFGVLQSRCSHRCMRECYLANSAAVHAFAMRETNDQPPDRADEKRSISWPIVKSTPAGAAEKCDATAGFDRECFDVVHRNHCNNSVDQCVPAWSGQRVCHLALARGIASGVVSRLCREESSMVARPWRLVIVSGGGTGGWRGTIGLSLSRRIFKRLVFYYRQSSGTGRRKGAMARWRSVILICQLATGAQCDRKPDR